MWHSGLARRTSLLCALAILAAAEPRPEFDVASIREVPRSKGKFKSHGADLAMSGNRFTLTTSLRGMIGTAYSLTDQEISGPVWLDANAFQIMAKAPADSTDEQLRLMCQSLLAERFRLTFHRGQQLQPVYALVPAKGGSKLLRTSELVGDPKIRSKPGRIVSPAASIVWLAGELSRPLGRKVLDQTGLPGLFRITLNYSPNGLDAQSTYSAKPKARDKARTDRDMPPSLFIAIQEQLGLRLEPQKGMVDLLVVDHIERRPLED